MEAQHIPPEGAREGYSISSLGVGQAVIITGIGIVDHGSRMAEIYVFWYAGDAEESLRSF